MAAGRQGRRSALVATLSLAITSTPGCLIDNPRYVTGQADDGKDSGMTGPGTGPSSMTSMTSAASTVSTTEHPPTTGTSLGTTSITTTGPVATADSGFGSTGPDAIECSAFDPQSCPLELACKPVPVVEDADQTQCLPVVPLPQLVWESCTPGPDGPDDCDAGFVCHTPRDPDIGLCTPLCFGDVSSPICEYAGTQCGLFGDGLFGLCLPACDPFETTCSDDEGCYAVPDEDGDVVTLACSPDESGDQGAAGDPCDSLNQCDPGLACVASEQLTDCMVGACCTPFCTVSSSLCGVGQDCISLWSSRTGPPPPSLEDLGLCIATS